MSEQIDSAAVRGKNMKNVIEPCALKRLKCLDRRKYIMYASLRDTRSRLRYFLNADNMEAESRIKKIMQKDAEVGRIAMAVPVIISRALEMFLKCLLTKTCLITESKLSTIVSVAHMKQCIESEKLFNFLKDLVEQVTSTASQRDKRGMSIWPIYRTKRHEMTVKTTAEVVEMGPRSSLDSLDNDSSSGESKLYICF